MQIRSVLLVLLAIALAPLCFGQSGGSDSKTLTTILAELRSIHEDIRAGQTMEALLAELQME
jgi:hypothetical protein